MQTAAKNIPKTSDSDKSRFFSKINKEGQLPDQSNPHYVGLDQCQEWTACLDSNGYGQSFFKGRQTGAHRVAWLIFHGEIPKGACVTHRCDNPKCVNINHLKLDTVAGNMMDKSRKQRGNQPTGEKHGKTKFPSSSIIQMREIYALGTISQKALANQFGISQSHAGRILNLSARVKIN